MKLLTSLILSSLLISNAYAVKNSNTFLIQNKTKYNLTFRINGHCSEFLGTLIPQSSINFLKSDLHQLCGYSWYCTIKAFTEKKCHGKSAGGITFSGENNVTADGGDVLGSVKVTNSTLVYSDV